MYQKTFESFQMNEIYMLTFNITKKMQIWFLSYGPKTS